MPFFSKKFYFTLLLFVAMIIGSCSPKQDLSSKKVPPGIIQPDTMVAILTDLQIAEARLRILEQNGQLTDSLRKNTIEKVLVTHQITKADLQKSNLFYQQNLALFEEIYGNVITRLTQLQTEISSTEKEIIQTSK